MEFVLIMVSTIGIKLSQLGVSLIRNCSASIQNLKLTTNTQPLK